MKRCSTSFLLKKMQMESPGRYRHTETTLVNYPPWAHLVLVRNSHSTDVYLCVDRAPSSVLLPGRTMENNPAAAWVNRVTCLTVE